MNQILNQWKRIFADNGSGDKDFTEPEARLRKAQKELQEAASALGRAADLLADFIKAKA